MALSPEMNRMNLLAIDVGNSNVTLGLFQGDQLLGHWRLQTVRERTADEYGLLIRQLLTSKPELPEIAKLNETSPMKLDEVPAAGVMRVDAAVVANVVPPLRPTILQFCRTWFGVEPLEVDSNTDTGIPIRYDPPSHVGADRIVNAVAAFQQWGGPCIVVDFGTATTFDAISADGCYLGGAIAPGMGISMEALFQRAARLPRIEFVAPREPIGRTTIESIQSGFVYGFVGQVEEIVRRFREELGAETPVIATGGLAEVIAAETRSITRVEPLLTLHGLRMIWERHCGQEGSTK